MAKPADWIIGIVVLTIVFSFMIIAAGMIFGSSDESDGGFFSMGGSVAVVEIRGGIFDAYNTVQELKKWDKKSSVKAIVVRLESPGGGAAASHEIYEQVKKISQKGKPVVMSMGSVAASGAYYIACAGTTIMANPSTTTGSIGVIAEFPNTEEFFKKIGLSFNSIISGKYKDSGNPTRKMRDDEREYFQELIDDTYEQFVEIVANGRNMTLDEVYAVADGRVFTGRQAKELKLVDELGTFEDAISLAKELAGLNENAPVRRTPRSKISLLSLLTSDIFNVIDRLNNVPVTQYILR